MKKIAIVLLVGLMVFTGCKKTEKGSIKKISLQEFFTKMDNKEDFVVYFGTSTCSACLEYKPVVEEMVKNYAVTIYYVELDHESADDKERLAAEYIDSIKFTPTTVFIKGGENIHMVVGKVDYRNLKQELVKYGFLKED